jgi:hypothetical protein
MRDKIACKSRATVLDDNCVIAGYYLSIVVGGKILSACRCRRGHTGIEYVTLFSHIEEPFPLDSV